MEYSPLQIPTAKSNATFNQMIAAAQQQLGRPLTEAEFMALKNGSIGPGQGALVGTLAGQKKDPVQEIISGLFDGKGAEEVGGMSLPKGGASALPTLGTGVADAAGASTTFSGGQVVAGEVMGSAPNGGFLMSTGATVPASAGTPLASGGAEAATSFFTGNGLLSEGAMGVGDYLPGVAGTIGAIDLIKRQPGGAKGALQGAASGAGIGYTVGGPVGAAIGAGIGGIGGLISKSGKSKDQKGRDQGRKVLQQAGFADNDFMVNLADGSKFNIGLDGGTKYTNIDGKSQRHAYDVDMSNAAATALIPRVKMKIMELMPGASEKQYSDLTGQIINAATSAGDANKNLDTIFGGKVAVGNNPPNVVNAPNSNAMQRPTFQNGAFIGMPNNSTQPQQQNVIPRTSTKSPGIGLDGKRINQWSKR